MMKPKIRFNGFTDDWEQRKLEEIYQNIGNAFVGTATPYYVDTGHFYLESNNIKDGQINRNNEVFINDEFYERQKDKWLHTGDMVMVQSGHVGHTAVIPEELDNSAAHALIMFRNPKIEIEPYFLNYQYQTIKSKRKINNITTGNTIKHILASDMYNFIVDVSDIEEQQQIANYFLELDHLITLHQRKCDGLKKLKKYMLQNMFPQNGEKTPKIRFQGFINAWEQRKLGDIAQITMGQSPAGSTYSDVPSDYILVQGNADLENGWVKPRVWTTQITKQAYIGDLIMSVRAPAGAMGKTSYNAVIGRGVAAIKGNEFIYQLLVKMDKEGYWKKDSTGSTFESLNSESIKNAEIKLPSNEEQTVIGTYFEQLDHLITLHQRKVEQMKNLKKYMLQNMFPAEK
ncbi:restriction endonuclease subunit S [Amedibacterium intestinale]|mgnify:CR=1 FL=1|uniref:restriction endonuclease subunit S n=1 Tax=Amedibacterium intestinale TaxID=2583452 RepID=UPI003992A438